MRDLLKSTRDWFLEIVLILVLCVLLPVLLIGCAIFGVKCWLEYISRRQIDDQMNGILTSEARAFASMGILALQTAVLTWGKETIGHSADWWKFLILSCIALGLGAWAMFCKKMKRVQCLLIVGMSLVVVWIWFALDARPLSYMWFVGLALFLLALSLVWGVFVALKWVPECVERVAKSSGVTDGSSIMLLSTFIGSAILTYARFMDKQIHGWYVDAFLYAVFIVFSLLMWGLFRKLAASIPSGK